MELETVLDGSIPQVDPEHLKKVLAVLPETTGQECHALSEDFIRSVCGSDSVDAIAVWARLALTQLLIRVGALTGTEDEDRYQRAIEKIATVDVPNGIRGFDFEGFVSSLR